MKFSQNIIKFPNGATYDSKELLTYESFLEKYLTFDLNLSMSNESVVWVTVRHYPAGINTERGFIENAVIINYYDTEIGTCMGYSLKSLNKITSGSLPTIPSILNSIGVAPRKRFVSISTLNF